MNKHAEVQSLTTLSALRLRAQSLCTDISQPAHLIPDRPVLGGHTALHRGQRTQPASKQGGNYSCVVATTELALL